MNNSKDNVISSVLLINIGHDESKKIFRKETKRKASEPNVQQPEHELAQLIPVTWHQPVSNFKTSNLLIFLLSIEKVQKVSSNICRPSNKKVVTLLNLENMNRRDSKSSFVSEALSETTNQSMFMKKKNSIINPITKRMSKIEEKMIRIVSKSPFTFFYFTERLGQ